MTMTFILVQDPSILLLVHGTTSTELVF